MKTEEEKQLEAWKYTEGFLNNLLKVWGVVVLGLVVVGGIAWKCPPTNRVAVAVSQNSVDIWHYPVKEIRVVDGDTSEVTLDLGMGIQAFKMVRILGVDTPEKNTPAGKAVKGAIERWVARESPLVAKYTKEDKFGGRFDGDLIGASGGSLAAFLLEQGLGRSYNGERKPEWTIDALRDIERKANGL